MKKLMSILLLVVGLSIIPTHYGHASPGTKQCVAFAKLPIDELKEFYRHTGEAMMLWQLHHKNNKKKQKDLDKFKSDLVTLVGGAMIMKEITQWTPTERMARIAAFDTIDKAMRDLLLQPNIEEVGAHAMDQMQYYCETYGLYDPFYNHDMR